MPIDTNTPETKSIFLKRNLSHHLHFHSFFFSFPRERLFDFSSPGTFNKSRRSSWEIRGWEAFKIFINNELNHRFFTPGEGRSVQWLKFIWGTVFTSSWKKTSNSKYFTNNECHGCHLLFDSHKLCPNGVKGLIDIVLLLKQKIIGSILGPSHYSYFVVVSFICFHLLLVIYHTLTIRS